MAAELKQRGDPRMSGKGALFGKYHYTHHHTRGFYSRYMKDTRVGADWVNKSDLEKEPLME